MSWTLALVPTELWERDAQALAAEAGVARRRTANAPAGDRREALRHHRLADRIEELARTWLAEGRAEPLATSSVPSGADSWWVAHDVPELPPPARAHLAAGGAVVGLADPFEATAQADEPVGEPAPAREPWRAPPGSEHAAAALFEEQLRGAISGTAPIVPSGVPNRVITEGLRRHADRAAAAAPVAARVVYRDGSEAAPFPLAALRLAAANPPAPDLRCALISLRHPEMDPLVDFAWIRNRVASQVRPAAQTDRLVHEYSRERLAELCALRPGLVVEVFQTGLEPAVVGFYRALAEQLIEQPGSVAVRPRYFRGGDEYGYGKPWA